MMQIFDYNAPKDYKNTTGRYPDDFGCTEFMDKHYSPWNQIPECPKSETWGSLISVWEVRNEFLSKYPRFVLEMCFGEGDQMCFANSFEIIDYLTSIMPYIMYHHEMNMMTHPSDYYYHKRS